MVRVVPAQNTALVADLLEEAQQITAKVTKMDIKTIDLDEFLALEERHHQIRLEIERLTVVR